LEPAKVKENLRLFVLNLNRHADAALGLDLQMPSFLANKPAVGPNGKPAGKYSDYTEEAKLLATLTLEVFTEESQTKPILNPQLIVKISEGEADEAQHAVLLKACGLAANKAAISFANATQKGDEVVSFSASGIKLASDLSDDWETDTLRTGCIGVVSVNLPRIVHECGRDETRFFDTLKERCELALRALGIKHRALKQYGKNALPFLMQGNNGDTYFRLESCSGIVNLAGFTEAVESFTGKPVSDEASAKFAAQIVQNTQAYVIKVGRKHGKRLFPSIVRSAEASARLAALDVEKYGVAKVKFSGTRETPYYPTTRRLRLQAGNFLSVPSDQLDTQRSLKALNAGASLVVVDASEIECKPEDLLKLTQSLMGNSRIEFLTFNRAATYCSNCSKSWFGSLHKCPSCGSIGTLVEFDRFKGT